jgi:hypothetical protein
MLKVCQFKFRNRKKVTAAINGLSPFDDLRL